MAAILEVQTKYCNKCQNQSYCLKPYPLVVAALYDLPCEQELLQMCEEKEKNDV